MTGPDDLNFRQKIFVEAFAGNAAAAAIEAGYSRKSAGSIGSKLLKNPRIAEAIQSREQGASLSRIADRQSRQAFWTSVMDSEQADMKDRLKASELLAKSEGDFLERPEGAAKNPVLGRTLNLNVDFLDQGAEYSATAGNN